MTMLELQAFWWRKKFYKASACLCPKDNSITTTIRQPLKSNYHINHSSSFNLQTKPLQPTNSINMKFSAVFAVLAASSLVAATPAYMAEKSKRQADLCPGTDSNAQCCATDVLGVADLNCANRMPSLMKTLRTYMALC